MRELHFYLVLHIQRELSVGLQVLLQLCSRGREAALGLIYLSPNYHFCPPYWVPPMVPYPF